MLTLAMLRKRYLQFVRISRWFIFSAKTRSHRFAAVVRAAAKQYGATDLIHDAYIQLFSQVRKRALYYKLSTLTINRLYWVSLRVLRLAHQRRRTLEVLESWAPVAVAPTVPEQAERLLLRTQVRRALQVIPYRERLIIEMLYGLGDGAEYTLREAGRVLRLSRGRVLQLGKRHFGRFSRRLPWVAWNYAAFEVLSKDSRCFKQEQLLYIRGYA